MDFNKIDYFIRIYLKSQHILTNVDKLTCVIKIVLFIFTNI